VLELILGGSLDDGQIRTLVRTFLALGGLVAAMIAVPVPLIAAFAESRYRAVGLVSLLVTVIHVGLSALALEVADTLEALALVASLDTILFLGLILALVYRGSPRTAAVLHGRETLLTGAVVAGAFLPWVVLGKALGGGLVRDALIVAAGAGTYAVLLRALRPSQWALVARLVEPLRPRSGPRPSAPYDSRP
jgi:hypothetical protein